VRQRPSILTYQMWDEPEEDAGMVLELNAIKEY
jgi:hypothetical protein